MLVCKEESVLKSGQRKEVGTAGVVVFGAPEIVAALAETTVHLSVWVLRCRPTQQCFLATLFPYTPSEEEIASSYALQEIHVEKTVSSRIK